MTDIPDSPNPDMEPRELEAARILAQCLANVGKHAEAADILKGVVKVNAKDVPARRALVAALLAMGDYAGAEPHAVFLAETTRGPDQAPALFFLAHALWGLGNLKACRRVVGEYEAALDGMKGGGAGGARTKGRRD